MLFIEKNDTEHQSFKYMHTLVTCIDVFQHIPYVGPPGKPIEVCRKTSFCYECGIISLFYIDKRYDSKSISKIEYSGPCLGVNDIIIGETRGKLDIFHIFTPYNGKTF